MKLVNNPARCACKSLSRQFRKIAGLALSPLHSIRKSSHRRGGSNGCRQDLAQVLCLVAIKLQMQVVSDLKAKSERHQERNGNSEGYTAKNRNDRIALTAITGNAGQPGVHCCRSSYGYGGQRGYAGKERGREDAKEFAKYV